MLRVIAAWFLLLVVPVPVARAVFEEGRITTDGLITSNFDDKALITNGVVYWQRGYGTSVAKWTSGISFSILWTGAPGEGIVAMDAANGKVAWATTQGRVLFYNGSSVITIKGAGNEVREVATDGSNVVYVESLGGSGTDINWEVLFWNGSGSPLNISNNPFGRDQNVAILNGKVAYQVQQFPPGSPLRTYFWPGSFFHFVLPVPAGMTNPWDNSRPAMGGDYVAWGTQHDGGRSYVLYHIPSNTVQNITGNIINAANVPFVSILGVAYNDGSGWKWRNHNLTVTPLPFGTYYELQGQELISSLASYIHIVDGGSGSSTQVSSTFGQEPSFSGSEVVWSAGGDIFLYAPEGRVPFPFHNPVCDSPPTPTSQSIGVGLNFTGTIQGSDPDPSDVLTLRTALLPSGATVSPPLPRNSLSPVSTVLSWTPTLADIGPHPFLFYISDNFQRQATCEFTLDVVCSPTAQLCDGIDNDCNGLIDDAFGVGDVCEGEGECGTGVLECAGLSASRCSTDPGGSADQSSAEICDGLDNDCDGTIDSPTIEVNDGLDNQCAGEPGFGPVDEITGDSSFHDPSDTSRYSWPPQTDATLYRVARSTAADFSVDCTTFIGSDPFLIDPEVPAAGGIFRYLVQPLAPNLGSWDRSSTGVERTFACGTEFVCDDGGDDDGDGLTDCADPDCAGALTCACAGGSTPQSFPNGMVGCSGMVTWTDRSALCGAGYEVCPAQAWVDHRQGLTPDANYWTDDDLLYNGTSSACYVSLLSGTSCAGEPMRVCTATVDPQGNTCDWIGCGWNSVTPNEHFGGCVGDTSAGTLCCDSSREQLCDNGFDDDGDGLTDCDDADCAAVASCAECAPGSTAQIFANGMIGCSGVVTFVDRATLCPSGYQVCSAQEWVDNRQGMSPDFNYWSDDELRYNGSSSFCWVSLTSGSFCGSTTPMRVCRATIDSLGNRCNWINCGWNTVPPNEYFGGCSGNTTAGALCCPP